jgi:hypothetical protein
MKRGAAKTLGLALSAALLIALIPLHERLLPGDASWTTLAAVPIFALGFVGVLSAVFDQQSGSSTFRSAGFGLILVIIGTYLAATSDGTWRAVPLATVIALGIWATADRDYPDEERTS